MHVNKYLLIFMASNTSPAMSLPLVLHVLSAVGSQNLQLWMAFRAASLVDTFLVALHPQSAGRNL